MSGPLDKPKPPQLIREPNEDILEYGSRVVREDRRNLFWWRVRGTFSAIAVYAAIGVFIIGLATVLSWWN